MDIRVEIAGETGAQDFRECVRNCGAALAQQTWEWGRVIQDLGQDQPVPFLARRRSGEVVGALSGFYFPGRYGSLLLSAPQAGGYGGVAVKTGPHREAVYQALLEAFVAEAQRRGCCLATICTAPFFGDLQLYRQYFAPDLERPNFFQFVELQDDFLTALTSKQRWNLKRNLRDARDQGLTVTLEDRDARFDRWYGIHARRLAEIGAPPLPRRLLEGARTWMVKSGLGFMAYVLWQGEVIGGGLFIGLQPVLDVFMMSSDSRHFARHPNTLLIYEVLRRAPGLGYRFFNWQSSNSRDSGVYAFKKSWGSREGVHHYLTRITGDITRLEQTPLEVVKQEYQWHYVMPYDRFPRVVNG